MALRFAYCAGLQKSASSGILRHMATEAHLDHVGERFTTTVWPLVKRAGDPNNRDSRDSLARLYWGPMYAYARRRGECAEDAEDVVQAVLARVFHDGTLAAVEPPGDEDASSHRGKFRNWLLTCLEHALRSRARQRNAQRRAGARDAVPLHLADVEARLAASDGSALSPDDAYLREWAIGLLESARETVRARAHARNELALFEYAAAVQDHEAVDTQLEAARRFGISYDVMKKRMGSFKRELRSAFRKTIAATLAHPTEREIDEEIAYLRRVLTGLPQRQF
jgi:DNA-directed RNA polymerase specialized sigma24 family protein